MKQIWKKLSTLFLTFACILAFLAYPVKGAVSSQVEDSILENFQYLIDMMNNYSEDEMTAQIQNMDSTFLSGMVDEYYGALDKVGSFKEILSSEVAVDEEKEIATVIMRVAFDKYNAKLTAKCNYNASATAQNFDDLWSEFTVTAKYPISALIKNAEPSTLVIAAIVIIGLIFAIYYMRRVNRKEVPKEESEGATVQETFPLRPEPEVSGSMNEEELAIVIAAAIAAYEEENPGGDGYVVRSIRKTHSNNWRRA